MHRIQENHRVYYGSGEEDEADEIDKIDETDQIDQTDQTDETDQIDETDRLPRCLCPDLTSHKLYVGDTEADSNHGKQGCEVGPNE